MSREDMEVIDIGVPLLSMHATVEGSSKVDLWNLYRFFKVFSLRRHFAIHHRSEIERRFSSLLAVLVEVSKIHVQL